MRILFDQGTPAPLRGHLAGHRVETAFERGWSALGNGALLDRAEAEGFELLVTTDRSLPHQQNFAGRRLSVLILSTTSWPRIQARASDIAAAIDGVTPGVCVELTI